MRLAGAIRALRRRDSLEQAVASFITAELLGEAETPRRSQYADEKELKVEFPQFPDLVRALVAEE